MGLISSNLNSKLSFEPSLYYL